ncbi:uncharacterized protein LOC659317 isoform X1 [Tribolium castaneum]|uniref:uncharacterized protein LOC659317 isoform X1 n=1 Tax=Tribolium castaneum TaxID=7070 RepID=UPI00046C0687|nr:PREDICTED: uncharacterized protein LOC659317 isoform X1 [Tribolium castaneum]|eukprot:XP_008193254.1 PREDICTED: uncharacterized protein LOC659317 isoform X1 [Tribolium castaneum]
MARAGMALRRGTSHGNAEGSDDVQRSIELLDRVLSEFDDVENANQVQNIQQMTTSTSTPQLRQVGSNTTTGNVSSTPDDESPSLGHQSEDDGYMSMNGRKPKFNLAFKPLAEVPVHHENASQSPTIMHPGDPDDFPPPPEEAQRLIATLLPKVSPAHRPKTSTNSSRNRQFPLTQLPPRVETIPPPHKFQNNEYTPIINGLPDPIHTATQTTLPKTRHQRPYGWENNDFTLNPPPPPPGYRFGSLPFQHGIYPITSPTRVPPRTIPTALERHREVKRRGSEDNLSSDLEGSALRPLSELADDEHFSDDSLEEMLPPPPPVTNKRASIAWEVPLDDDALLTPGSTKVIGRRRRKSGSHSSTSSIPNRLKELEDWPDPPPCTTEDEVTSPFSDSDDHVILPPELNSDHLSGTSTYIVRRGKKDRKALVNVGSSLNSNSSLNSRLSSDLSIPALNSRLSRELNTPSSRYSVDLSTPHSRLSQELNSPKSRYSLDLNNSRHLSQELSSSPSRLSADLSSSRSSTPSKQGNEFKKHSTTFDNIKSLIKEGRIENYNTPPVECTSDLNPNIPPIVRVVSLPSLNAEEYAPRRELDVTVEEEEDGETSQDSAEISPLRQIEQNISELLERRDIEVIQKDEKCLLNGVESLTKKEKRKAPPRPKKGHDLQKSSSHNEIQRSEDYYRQLLIEAGNPFPKRNGIQKSESAKEMLIAHRESRPLPTSTSADFPVRVEVLQHDFPPLPPSPVEEDDEYSEIVHPTQNRADTLPASSEPPVVPPHRDPVSNSLKTRSMDANYSRGRRSNFYSSSSSRRTLPMELQESKRKPFQKQEEHHLQTSCSLPETPIFARGCDIPRTPHRRAPDVPGGTAPRQSNTIGSLNTIGNMSTGGYRRGMSNPGLEQAFRGAELLRLAGGPGRGWYPKQRHRRPASIEHLDRMASGHNPWEPNRKPLTLPPNLTPKFFQRSPRDALRRVTSLLIRKGNNGKEPRKEKEIVSPTIHENANGEEVQKKKGFFKSFWKRSRHYSLEQQ